jgi:hypothetical protein
VETELQAGIDEIESLHKSTIRALKAIEGRIKQESKLIDKQIREMEAIVNKRFANMALSFTAALFAVITIPVFTAWSVTKFYIKPQELKEQLLMKQELEKSGMLARMQNGTFIVLPDGAECNWTVGKKNACRLPDPQPQRLPQNRPQRLPLK